MYVMDMDEIFIYGWLIIFMYFIYKVYIYISLVFFNKFKSLVYNLDYFKWFIILRENIKKCEKCVFSGEILNFKLFYL